MTMDSPAILDHQGRPRRLACLPPRPGLCRLPRFAATNALIPRSSWRSVDLSPLGVPVLDQGESGSCVGHGSASAFWFAWLIAGGTVPTSGFSPTSLYALINGGRDDGAIVSDAMTALTQQGICTMAEVPESILFESDVTAAAKATRARFKLADAYNCDSFDAVGSALQLGFPVSFGISLALDFMNLDSEGVAGHGWGYLGGHCMCAYGTTQLKDGSWAIRVRNSWGPSWGINGNCLLIEDHFGSDTDAFAIRADVPDPSDPNPLPVAS